MGGGRRAYGEAAPGLHRGLGLRLPPRPDTIAALTYPVLHRFDIERRRADALVLAARRSARLEEAAAMPIEERLQRLPGLGAWTATSGGVGGPRASRRGRAAHYGIPIARHMGASRRAGRR